MPQKPDPSWNYATARQTRNSNAHKTQDVRYTHKKKVIALNQHVPLSLSLFTVVSLCLVQHHDIWVIEIVHCIYTHYRSMLYLFFENRKTTQTHQIMLKNSANTFCSLYLLFLSFFRHVLLELLSLNRNFLSCIFWHDKKKHFYNSFNEIENQ
jgi:hypothetical protein